MAAEFDTGNSTNRSLLKKQSLVAMIVVFAVIAVLTAILLLRGFLPGRRISNPPGTVGNTAGNLNNGGLFCEYNDVVYFSNPYDDGALYAMASDESDIRFLSSSVPQNLLAGGDYLYYFQTGVECSCTVRKQATENKR